jgi:hypothetical protein
LKKQSVGGFFFLIDFILLSSLQSIIPRLGFGTHFYSSPPTDISLGRLNLPRSLYIFAIVVLRTRLLKQKGRIETCFDAARPGEGFGIKTIGVSWAGWYYRPFGEGAVDDS